jgi:LysM repeat protein
MCALALTVAWGGGTALAQDDSGQGNVIHVVQPGENLFRISLRYNVSMASIAAANNIANYNLIFAGQQLIIPAGGGTGTTPTQPAPTTPTAPGGSTGSYTVVSGDTLARIAQRFGTTVQAIVTANGIANPNLIFPGQVLNIPGATGTPGGANPTPIPSPGGGVPISGGFELGGHVDSFSYPDQMRGARMTWVKRQIRWNPGQPASIVQGAIDQARANGFKILLGIVGSDVSLLRNNRAQYIQEFSNFLSGVAALGPDGVEIWNEPNLAREWPAGQVSGAAYTEMLRAGYQAIKSVNQNIMVISGAPSPTGFFGGAGCANDGCNDDTFIRQMAQAGAANFADCIGIHYNEGILPPSATSGDPRGNSGHYSRYFQTMVNLYASVFPSKQLCFTELGYLTREGLGPLPGAFAWAANTTGQQQAEWLAQAVTRARQSGRVRLMIIWNVDFTRYDNDPMAGYAIIRPDGTCRACVTMGAAMQ